LATINKSSVRVWLYELTSAGFKVYDGYLYKEGLHYAYGTGLGRKVIYRTYFKGIRKNRRCSPKKETIYENFLWLEARNDELAKYLFLISISRRIKGHQLHIKNLNAEIDAMNSGKIEVID
jgi:hypothetical protein